MFQRLSSTVNCCQVDAAKGLSKCKGLLPGGGWASSATKASVYLSTCGQAEQQALNQPALHTLDAQAFG
jgi:hypothetical protein